MSLSVEGIKNSPLSINTAPAADASVRSKYIVAPAFRVLVYLILFDVVAAGYKIYVVKYWHYNGYYFNPDVIRILVAIVAVAAFSLWSPARCDLRGVLLNLTTTTYIVPSAVVFSYSGEPYSSLLLVMLAFGLVYLVSAIPLNVPSFAIISAKLAVNCAILALLLGVVAYVVYGARNFINIDIWNVYKYRRAAAASHPAIFGYITMWMTDVGIPLALAGALTQKRYITVAIVCALSTSLFALTSAKWPLFLPVAIIFIFCLLSKTKNQLIWPVLVCAVVGVGVVGILASGGVIHTLFLEINSLFLRRTLIVPPFLDYKYLEFFGGHQNYWWSTSKITLGLIPAPYTLHPPNLIGWALFNSPATSANTGIVGSGYAQGGVIGVVLYAVILGGIIAILQSFGSRLGHLLVLCATLSVTSEIINSTDLMTAFGTHGLIFAMLALALIKPRAGRAGENGPHG